MNPFEQTSACADRLYKEYKKHPRLIIACDFDDTVFNFHGYPDTDFKRIKNALTECAALDFYIVCFTASQVTRYDFIRKHFSDSMGISLDGINQNVIELPYGNNGKIYYNILLDDRAGLGQALDILEKLLTKINHEKHTATNP